MSEVRITPEGIEKVLEIQKLFATTNMTLKEIALSTGFNNVDEMRILYTVGRLSGVLDG